MGRRTHRVRSRLTTALVIGTLVATVGIGGTAAGVVSEGGGDADLSGTVFDGTTFPAVGVDGVTVCLSDVDNAVCKVTDAAGNYSFSQVAQGSYTLLATPPAGTNYLPVGIDLNSMDGYVAVPALPVTLSTSGPHDQDVTLLKGGRIGVTVTLPDGTTPAPAQPLTICRTDAPGPGSCPDQVPAPDTDASGQATTAVLLPGFYRITAGYASNTAPYPNTVTDVEVLEDATTSQAVRLLAGGALDGYVRDAASQPVQGATVSIAIPPNVGTSQATTDASGYYSFPSLAPGSYAGTVYPPSGGAFDSTPTGTIEITEGADLHQDFVLPPATVIAGTASPGPVVASAGGVLVCGGVATPNLTFPPSCSDSSPFGLVLLSSPSATVAFSYRPPAPGTYTIRAAYYTGSSSVGSSPPVTVTVAAGQTVTCTLVAGSPGSASCGGPPSPPPGTVVLTVDEPVVAPGYYPGFCADPGVPVLLSTSCSDGRPAAIEFGVPGGGTRTVSLAPGTYNAAMGDPALSFISPIGSLTVVSGQTTFCSFTLSAGPDCAVDDGDGIDEPPDGFPAAYDGNGDGFADADQPHVTSLLPAVGTQPVTIAAPDGSTLRDVVAQPVPASPAPPPGATFPVGVLGFSVELADGQTSADVEIHLPTGSDPSGYLKYQGGAWVDFTANATITGDVVTLHLVDGGAGDADGAVNGVIVDPGAPVGSRLTAFLAPIDADGHTAKAGSTVPVKWRFLDQLGVPVADPSSVESLTSVPCGSSDAPTPVTGPGRSGLQYAGDGSWQVNWKTAKRDAGECLTLTLVLTEGFTQSVDVQLR